MCLGEREARCASEVHPQWFLSALNHPSSVCLSRLPEMNPLTQKAGVAVKTLDLRRGPRELAHFPFFLLPVCGEAGMKKEM